MKMYYDIVFPWVLCVCAKLSDLTKLPFYIFILKHCCHELQRSWAEAKELVEAKPHLVYVGAFPRCDYYELDNEHDDNEGNDDNNGNNDDDNLENNDDADNSQHSGRLQRRSALHELCRQCAEVENHYQNMRDNHESDSQVIIVKDQIYELARQIIRVSHCSVSRGDWDHRHGYDTRNNTSLLTLYVADLTCLHILCSAQHVDFKMISIFLESVSTPMSDQSCEEDNTRVTIELPSILELLTIKNRLGSTPLHYLVENRSCSAETLDGILGFASEFVARMNIETMDTPIKKEAHLKEAFLTTDHDCETPIHWALESKVPSEYFRIILKYGGTDALWCVSLMGEFPFHQFARSCEEDLLVTGDETATEEENFRHFVALLAVIDEQIALEDNAESEGKSGYSAISLLASSLYFPCPTYLFKLALRYHENDLTTCDKNKPTGLMPLHLALSASQNNTWKHMLTYFWQEEALQVARATNESNVSMILKQKPECANMYSKEGRLPLHYAVTSQISIDIIQTLLKIYPAALSSLDPITGLYPWSLAAAESNNSLDVVFLLARSCPSVLAL